MINSVSPRFLVSITQRKLASTEVRSVLRELFSYARTHHSIDRIESEALPLSSVEEVAKNLIDEFVQRGIRMGGRVIINHPSNEDLELAERIAPHVMSLNLMVNEELVAGASDEVSTLDLIVLSQEDLQQLLERFGPEITARLSIDTAELAP